MSYNDIVQAIADASKDADTLEQVINGEAETQVKSRLGRMVYTLSTISSRINNLTNQANQKLTELQDAINAASAAGAGANGWIAQLIADASGQNQQSLNNGLESIAQLLATCPPDKGFRVYVKSYHSGLNQGGGYFVSTQKAGLVANGVTIFASQNPSILWVRSGIREVTPFMAGAKGDRVQDDAPAFMTALASNLPVKAEVPSSGYRFKSPISIAANQSLIGDGKQIPCYIDHTGSAFKLMSSGTLKNFVTYPFADRHLYDTIQVGETGADALFSTVHNVKGIYPRSYLKLYGAAYWNTFTELDCFKFKDYGIHLVNDGTGKNNNYFQFKALSSNAVATTAAGGGHTYSYSEVDWEQASIRVYGSVNVFVGGENAPAKWGLIIDGGCSANRFTGMYGEHQLYPIKTAAGTETFYDGLASMGTPQIHPDSIVIGQSGRQNTRYARLGIAPIAAQKELKALWFFNEGNGTKVIDNSGNRKHLTVVNPVWNNSGRWGKTIELDSARSTYINPIPLDTLDWTQPFTFAACVRITNDSRDNPLLTFRTSNTSYSILFTKANLWAFVDYDGTTVQTTSANKMLKSPQDGYSWIVIYFDPVNKTLTTLDTECGIAAVSTPNAPRFSAWVAGISSVALGFRDGTGLGGSLSFVGFWQRRLNMSEVSDMVNMEVPNLYPSGAPMRIDDQPNNAINLRPTATNADIISALNQIATENNELRNKFRDAGIMLS